MASLAAWPERSEPIAAHTAKTAAVQAERTVSRRAWSGACACSCSCWWCSTDSLMNSCGSGPSSMALRSFAECSVYGSQPSQRFANGRGSLLGLSRGDVKMSAGTQRVGAIDEHEDAVSLQGCRDFF